MPPKDVNPLAELLARRRAKRGPAPVAVPKQLSLPPLEFERRRAPGVSMQTRDEVERFCREKIRELTEDYAELKADVRAVRAALRETIRQQSGSGSVSKEILHMFQEATDRYQKILGNESEILSTLMRQYELFSELDRPEEDNPLYTPVQLVIESTPPPEALVAPRFQRPEDEYEPGRPG